MAAAAGKLMAKWHRAVANQRAKIEAGADLSCGGVSSRDMSLDASYKKRFPTSVTPNHLTSFCNRWDTFDDSSESEDDAAGSSGDEAAPPNAVEVLSDADLERMAVACEIEAESRKVLHDMETTAFAFSGAARSFGEYFDTSMGYVDLDDLENGVLGDLRAGFYDDVKAHEWRGKEAVAFLFYARTRAGIAFALRSLRRRSSSTPRRSAAAARRASRGRTASRRPRAASRSRAADVEATGGEIKEGERGSSRAAPRRTRRWARRRRSRPPRRARRRRPRAPRRPRAA